MVLKPVTSNALVLVLAGLAVMPKLRVSADERAQAFLDGLLSRQYYDLALEYLERAASDPLVPPTWKEAIPVHKGVTLIESGAELSDEAEREARLNEATRLLEGFLAERPGHPYAGTAATWLAQAVLQRARWIARKLDATEDDSDRPAVREEAEKLFADARRRFEQRSTDLAEAIQRINSESGPREQLDRLRSEQLPVKLIAAVIAYETAGLFKSDRQYAAQLKEAAESFKILAEEYRQRLIGLEALLYLGQIHQDLGEAQKALAEYEQLLEVDELPASLSARAAARAIDCLLDPSINQPEKARELGEARLRATSARPESAEADQLRIALARAYQACAAGGNTASQGQLVALARKQLLTVAADKGPYQREAQTILAQLRSSDREATTSPAETRGFSSARLAADQAREQMLAAETLIQVLEGNLVKAEDADYRAELEGQIRDAKRDGKRARGEALALYRRALEFALEAEDDELNETRYLFANLAYFNGDYYDAAVIGEFVARHYPHHPTARMCANLAMASYSRLFQKADGSQDHQFETGHLIEIAKYIVATWPHASESADALLHLVSFNIHRGNLDEAERNLALLPQDASQRPGAELRLGQALWRSYVQQDQGRDKSAGVQPPKNFGAQDLRERALDLLADGFAGWGSQPPDRSLVPAALALAQIYVETGRPQRALEVLDDKTKGLLRLVQRNDPLVQSPGLVEAVYKTALRATIATISLPDTDAQSAVRDALALIDALRTAVGDEPDARERLLATYIGLANDLQHQLRTAPASVRPPLAQGFQAFLERVAEGTSEPDVLNWIAETYFNLAEGLQQNGTDDGAARDYYRKARDGFATLAQRARSGKSEPTSHLALQATIRLAAANQRLGDHQRAVDAFEQVLRERNNLLNVQIEAAQTYQEAAESGSVKLYDRAVQGGRPDKQSGKNTIWGWQRIAQLAAQQMRKDEDSRRRFSEVFFEANYNIALCRFRQALRAPVGERRTRLSRAKRTILATAGLYPDLGGQDGKVRFDRLLKQIQEQLGEPAEGLAAGDVTH
jgi:TolA-binding protein